MWLSHPQSWHIAMPSGEGGNHPIYFGRDKAILQKRERIKRKTLEARRLHHRQRAA
jgi:hypothetical protein